MSFIVSPYHSFPSAGGEDTGFAVGHTREALNTSTGNQSFTITWSDGGNRTPQIVMLELIGATTVDTHTADLIYGVGAYDGTNEYAQTISSEDGQANSVIKSMTVNDHCLIGNLADGTALDLEADAVSFAEDTFTINITNAPTSAYFVKVVAFAGCDAYEVGQADPSGTDAGTVNKTGLGQACTALIVPHMSHPGGMFDDTERGAYRAGYGYYSWDGATARQACQIMYHNHNTASGANEVLWLSGSVATGHANTGWNTPHQSWAISNHASGFTITTNEESSGIDTDHNWFYVALSLPSGIEACAGSFTTPASGTKSITTPSFTPQALLTCAAVNNNASGTRETSSPSADSLSMGSALSSSDMLCSTVLDDQGAATIYGKSRASASYMAETYQQSTKQFDLKLDSWDASTGFTVSSDNYSNGRRVVYLAFEEKA